MLSIKPIMRASYSISLLDAGKVNQSAYSTTIPSEVVSMILAPFIEVIEDLSTCKIQSWSYEVGSSSKVASYVDLCDFDDPKTLSKLIFISNMCLKCFRFELLLKACTY